MIRARIERDADGVHRIIVQRAKFKHWFELGTHKATDAAFERALFQHLIQWPGTIVEHNTLFGHVAGRK